MSKAKTITTKAATIKSLLRQLIASEPKERVHGSFLLGVGGMLHGLSAGRIVVHECLPSTVFRDGKCKPYVMCGTSFVGFADALARETFFDPPQGVTPSRIIELLVMASEARGLQVRKGRRGSFLITKSRDAAQRGRKGQAKSKTG